MKIIFSPSKKMVFSEELITEQQSFFLKEANYLLHLLKSCSAQELQNIWQISTQLFIKYRQQLDSIDTMRGKMPSIYAYSGLSFQHLSVRAMTDKQILYLEKHLRILSAMYGVLKPMDAVVPYRLEMQATIGKLSLKKFWQEKLRQYFQNEEIINVASKEYSEDWLKNYPGKVTNVIFAHLEGKRLKTKATMAKIGRGDLVYMMAEKEITSPDELRTDFDHYTYCHNLSSENKIIYLYE